MQARWCSPVELRGAAVHGAGSRHSITAYLVFDICKRAQTERNGVVKELRHFHILKFESGTTWS